MKIQFDKLTYQDDAIQSVLAVFEGQQIRKSEFTIMDHSAQGKLFNEKGIGNKIDISLSKLLHNVHQLQITQGIPIAKDITRPFPQFNVEMETGTGKTFVYIKSILEMNRKYGFTKFIIVVPSIAIKEGVMKTFEMTREYFKAQMQGQIYRPFIYESSQLEDVKAFASSDDIEIMIINIQAFSKSKKNNDNMNIIYRNDRDDLNGIAPIELISETNPIVIIDEPQSVDNTENAQAAIAALKPSLAFRFSATHKNKSYPLIYKLGPVEAYHQQLVKQIEVAGIKRSIDSNEAYIKLVSIKSTKKTVTATIEMLVRSKSEIEKKELKLTQGDELYSKSKRLDAYQSVGFVKDISAEPGNEYIEFSGEPSIIRLSQYQDEDLELKRGQIRKTIEEHLNKELKLNPQGIKVLSLFFIDNVANYRQYDDQGNEVLGVYGQIFEEEYKDALKSEKYKKLRDFNVPVEEVHNGYFSVDSKKQPKNTTGSSREDDTTYSIIMKDKEDLLTLHDATSKKSKAAHKLRFIFSHSALKEGWDNPNVFQVCTLLTTDNVFKKRQQIGRGLRIAVNQEGVRIPGFEVNTLTVMANESYDDFASALQTEYEEEGMEFGVFRPEIFSSLIISIDGHTGIKTPLGHDYSEKLVRYLKENEYIDNNLKGKDSLARAIKEKTFEIPEDFIDLALDIKEKIIEAIKEKINIDKIELKDAAKKHTIKLNKAALTGPFLELWDRIKYKTNYAIELNTEKFIKQASIKLDEELIIRINKLEYERHTLETSEAGITTIQEESTVFATKERHYEKAPDIVTFLQNETKLKRSTLIRILKESGTLSDFKRNPQTYMTEAARIINSAKRMALVDGIKYEKSSTNAMYDQSQFLKEEIETYSDSIVQVSNNRSPYNHIVVDSAIEKEFAEACEKDQNVQFYIKLPNEFKINTPLGKYNPDWALALEKDGQNQLYFVVETKSSLSSDDLRPIELAKIRCGEKHFSAIQTGITFKKATQLQDIY